MDRRVQQGKEVQLKQLIPLGGLVMHIATKRVSILVGDNDDSKRVLDLFEDRKVPYKFTLVIGTPTPELILGARRYTGFDNIKKALDQQQV